MKHTFLFKLIYLNLCRDCALVVCCCWRVVRQSREPGWLEGILCGKRGLIPHNYVEFLNWCIVMAVAVFSRRMSLQLLQGCRFLIDADPDCCGLFSLLKWKLLCRRRVIDSCIRLVFTCYVSSVISWHISMWYLICCRRGDYLCTVCATLHSADNMLGSMWLYFYFDINRILVI